MTPNEKILKLTTENEKLLKNLSDQIKLEYESKSKLEKAQENIRVRDKICCLIYLSFKLYLGFKTRAHQNQICFNKSNKYFSS